MSVLKNWLKGRDAAARAVDEASLDELARWLTQARRTVVFTGAGISTESGIPDFRSPGGLWEKNQPIEFSEFLESEQMRREYWRRKFAMDPVIRGARPNAGHEAVARLVRDGVVSCVITQNIDGLHQAAGVPDTQVVELHGNTTYAKCLSCGVRAELDDIRRAFEADGAAPVCGHCGGWLKTGTISFGQPMPVEAMARAERETLDCDLFIAAGSSLVVYPAAAFPQLAVQRGARLVILNREPTGLDAIAHLVLHCEIGEALRRAVELCPAHAGD